MTDPAALPASTLHLLYDDLRLLFDQGHDTIATASLQTVCLAATSTEVPFGEREWHAHVLRRQLAAAYRSAGYVLLDGAFYTHGLLDVLGDLAREDATGAVGEGYAGLEDRARDPDQPTDRRRPKHP